MGVLPTHNSDNFTCPHCHVLAQQDWVSADSAFRMYFSLIHQHYLNYRSRIKDYQQQAISDFITDAKSNVAIIHQSYFPDSLSFATCSSCDEPSVWMHNKMVYPITSNVPSPNSDLSEEIKKLYQEAASITEFSPRGATAILRLALQKLLIQLGKKGKDINSDIKEMVAGGLSPKIQQALDIVRVVGNNAVHPGQIDMDDNNEIASRLFHILNFIADELISKPKELENLYSGIIPETTKQQIKTRDSK